MASKSIRISIGSALNAAGFSAARRALSSLTSSVKGFAKGIGANLMNIKAGFDLVTAGVRKFLDLLSKGMEFERMTVQFKSLTGSMDLARQHMKDLQELGKTPPFSLEQFAAASRMMLKMSGGAVGFAKDMKLVGDVAAATGNDIETVGRAFGLAYQVIRDGKEFGRAGSQLVNLGILTKAQVEEFNELSKAGTNNASVWEQLCGSFEKYRGAMADTEKTTKGLVEAIQGEATAAVTEFSSTISEEAKPALEGVLKFIRQLNEDGTIAEWADICVEAFGRVAEGAQAVVGPIAKALSTAWKGIKGYYESMAQMTGNFVGTLAGGGSFGDALSAAGDGFKQGWIDAFDLDGAEAESRETKRLERIAAKAAKTADLKRKKEEEAAKAAAEAKKRVEEDMARAQMETDIKAAEEEQKKIHEEMKKLDEQYEREEEARKKKAAKDEAEAERRELKALHDERMAQLDAQEAKLRDQIAVLQAVNAGDPMGRVRRGEIDQKGEERGRRQRINDSKRMIDAEAALQEKMRRNGATLDDVSGLGRLSNLEKAALDSMRLKRAQNEQKKLQQKRDDLQQSMADSLDNIDTRLAALGL